MWGRGVREGRNWGWRLRASEICGHRGRGQQHIHIIHTGLQIQLYAASEHADPIVCSIRACRSTQPFSSRPLLHPSLLLSLSCSPPARCDPPGSPPHTPRLPLASPTGQAPSWLLTACKMHPPPHTPPGSPLPPLQAPSWLLTACTMSEAVIGPSRTPELAVSRSCVPLRHRIYRSSNIGQRCRCLH